MNLNTEQYKKLVTFMLSNFKALETEILAYRTLVFALKVVEPDYPFDESLEKMRKSPAMRQVMDAKYDPILKTLLEGIDQAASEQELSEFLLKWKPEGPTN